MIWPNTLPQNFQVDAYTEESEDYVIQTDMKSAEPQQRHAYFATVKPFGGKMIITTAQKNILSAFWLANCAIKFSFPEPLTGNQINVRFTDKIRYEEVSKGYYYATIKLEQIL